MSPGPTPTPSGPRTSQGKCLTVGGRADGGFLQYTQLLNPRNSMSITNTKGLLNMPGQNNCFLNSAVQVLWHLDIFRRSFRELCGHACMEDSCIFCALKELFAQFQYSQESALPPDALRRALAETFCDQRRFQLGFMDDAAECFENILMRIHFHIANNESEDMCSAIHCIPHQKFAMTLVEQTVCHACGATSEPLPFTQMVHYVPSSALCSQAKLMKEKSDQGPSFSELLKRAGGLGDLRDCPSSCGAVIQIRKTLMNRPEIVSIGLVWDSERPTIEHIMDVFKTIGMSLKLQDVFHSVVDSRWASAATHQLVGIVTYYGKHYSTFFFHTKLRVWIYFDDAAVREIGPKWEQVVEKCCRGHFQPLLLLYANPHGSPVNTSTAPRVVTLVSGHKKNVTGKESCSVNLGHETNSRIFSQNQNSNQRRALTPNPEVSCDLSANIQPRRAVTPSGELSWFEDSSKEQTKVVESIPFGTHLKDNSVPLTGVTCTNYNEPYQAIRGIVRNSNQLCTQSNMTENTIPKPSRVSTRLSVPNCAFYSELYQSKVNGNVVGMNNLNRPASVDDILQNPSSTNVISDAIENVYPPDSTLELNSTVVDEHSGDGTYISRRTVENVLHLQKLQRQRSVNCKTGNNYLGQRNSSSSLESLDNVFVFRDKSLNGQINLKLDLPDSSNIARRRDSGNWSGDRNSASSSSTTSLDNPYFYVVGNKRGPNCVRNIGRAGEPPTLTDPGYDSFSLSSSDSYPSAVTNSPGKMDSRLGQIPENVQTAFFPYDLSQLQYCLKDMKNSEHFPFGFKDECDKLCAEADIFVAKSIERENVGDISMAALLSDTAAAKARAAMDVPYTNSQALAMAKMKHSMCLIRSSNLHKKLKEAEAAMRRKQKESSESCRSQQNGINNSQIISESNSHHGKIVLENSHDDSSVEQKSTNSSQNTDPPNSDKNIEIYATLPKRSLKKKGALSSFVESLTGEDSSDEKTHKDKLNCKQNEENNKSDNFVQKTDSNSVMDKDQKVSKSPNGKKKNHSFAKVCNKESDLSDYSSEWEQTKKPSLYRTYSGPTSNSKNELSDLRSGNTTFTDHPTKKQHRIRRKLMGGFMRRKNRSLPDLREGQDSGSEAARSFDDCFFTQTPVSCRKRQEKENSSFPHTETTENIPHNCRKVSEASHTTNVPKLYKKNVARAHTPPPYKPPPPIAHSHLSISPKKTVQHFNTDSKHEVTPQNCINNSVISSSCQDFKSRNMNHPVLSREPKNHKKLSDQHSFQNHDEMSSKNAAWLKELQLKQEEINQRRKLQEEKDNWKTECKSSTNEQSVCPNTSEVGRDIFNKKQIPNVTENELFNKQQKLTLINGNSCLDAEQQKSVRDLASKFEKISFLSPNSVETLTEDKGNSALLSPVNLDGSLINTSVVTDKNYATPPQTTASVLYTEVEHSRPHLMMGHYMPQSSDKPIKQTDYPSRSAVLENKDRLNVISVSKLPYSTQSSSGSIYNPHLTDAQLTNVLRIGTNRSSFRSSNVTPDIQDDHFGRYPRDIYAFQENKRPDKPPDYETAIQRLELLRSDRNFSKFYTNNACINFEAILEQAKKKRGPKKSVTFSDKVVLVACAGDEDNDFIPNPLLERVYKQHFMQKPNIDVQPSSNNEIRTNSNSQKDIPISESLPQVASASDLPKPCSQSPCNLCHKKMVESPKLYCPDCAYYMSRFQQK